MRKFSREDKEALDTLYKKVSDYVDILKSNIEYSQNTSKNDLILFESTLANPHLIVETLCKIIRKILHNGIIHDGRNMKNKIQYYLLTAIILILVREKEGLGRNKLKLDNISLPANLNGSNIHEILESIIFELEVLINNNLNYVEELTIEDMIMSIYDIITKFDEVDEDGNPTGRTQRSIANICLMCENEIPYTFNRLLSKLNIHINKTDKRTGDGC